MRLLINIITLVALAAAGALAVPGRHKPTSIKTKPPTSTTTTTKPPKPTSITTLPLSSSSTTFSARTVTLSYTTMIFDEAFYDYAKCYNECQPVCFAKPYWHYHFAAFLRCMPSCCFACGGVEGPGMTDCRTIEGLPLVPMSRSPKQPYSWI